METKDRKKGKTAFQKIAEKCQLKVFSDGSRLLWLDKVFGHDVTTPLALDDMRLRGLNIVFNPNRIKMMVDHVSPAKDTDTAIQEKIMREFCAEHGIEIANVGKDDGVCHALIPQKGWIRPGGVYIMGDSHTCTHGAFGDLAFGVGTTELEIALITGLVVLPPQKVIRVNFVGNLPANVFAKDLILALIKKIGVKGATNAVLEFGGPVIDGMSMEGRMTIANMSVECGATSGMMNVDQCTIDYLWPALVRSYDSKSQALRGCQCFNSDSDAEYDQIIEINVSDMVPVTTINFSVGDVVPVAEIAGKQVDQVFIGSCTNGRIEDLRIVASIIRQLGGKVDSNTRVIVIPATKHIYARALKEGLIEIFLEAGCVVCNPNCGACLGMSCGVVAPGEVCLSTTNRNFSGRMGEGGMVHLASPATAAITAIYGAITEPAFEMCRQALEDCRNAPKGEAVKPTDWKEANFEKPDYEKLAGTIETGQERNFSGAVFYLPLENVDTDRIIPAKYLSLSKKIEFGKHCLENVLVSSEERNRFNQSRILVAEENFGSGSSREQAVHALEQAGIRCVIAPSFARIFETSMFANGLLCITLPQEKVDQLFREKPIALSIDWENGRIKWGKWGDEQIAFSLSDNQKEKIRKGGSLGIMLELARALQEEGKI